MSIQYLRIGGQAGDMLFMALQWAQYSSGMRTPILESSVVYDHMETIWILSLHQFLVKQGLTLQVYPSYVMPLQCMHDRYIMQIAYNLGIFLTKQMDQLNHMRLFLQVLSVASIVTADGMSVLRSKLIKKCHKSFKATIYQIVIQEILPQRS